MWFKNFFKSLTSTLSGRRPTRRRLSPARPCLEALEDRFVPSTFTVTNLLDSGAGSLRAAVLDANANPGADDIDFAVTGTIGLTSGQLDITDSLTINGPSADALTVSGSGVSRIFGIVGDPTVTIANLTVANGSATDSRGGGIFMAGGTVTLDHVTVSGNSAVGSSGTYDPFYPYYSVGNGLGGGLYVAGGTLTLDQCTVSGNYAAGGAGLSDIGQGGDGGFAAGGGLYVAGGTVHVNQSTVSGNGVYGGAGGDGLTYSGEQSYGGFGGSADGGGISVAAGSVEIRQSSIFDNTASGGAGGRGYDRGSYPEWPSGGSWGGGLSIASAAPPLADLDTYTVSDTINNIADIDPNISGPYTSNGSTFNPTLAISDVSTLEGNTGTHAITFTVSVSAASSQPITVAYTTANGTATVGSDYQFASGTLTIPAGQTTETITVLVNGDGLPEPNETFFVNLSSATNATIVDGQAVGTILDDEPLIFLSPGYLAITEGDAGTTDAVFTVSLSAAYDQDVTVDYATSDDGGYDDSAIAGSDYLATAGTLRFTPGQTSQTIRVPVIGDQVSEWDEYFYLNLYNASSNAVGGGRSVAVILNDEPPEISIHDVTQKEGNTRTFSVTFGVGLSVPSTEPVTVNYSTTNGSALAGGDYQAASGTLNFAPGETWKAVTVDVIGDRLAEANETFFVILSSPTNATIADGLGVVTIVDDEPRVSISDVTKSEGRRNKTTLFTFTVTLSDVYDQPVTMSFRTVNGTATTGDGDYIARTGTLTFAPGETTKTITIEVKGDSKKEADETFYLDLFGLSSNALFTKNRGLGTILNDD